MKIIYNKIKINFSPAYRFLDIIKLISCYFIYDKSIGSIRSGIRIKYRINKLRKYTYLFSKRLAYHRKHFFTFDNNALTSTISIILVFTIFFSVTGGIMFWGPRLIGENKALAQQKSDLSYYDVMHGDIEGLMKNGLGSSVTSDLVVDDGSVSIDSSGDRVALSYCYDPDYDFVPSGVLDGDNSFSIDMVNDELSVDKAFVSRLSDTCFLAGTRVLMADGGYKNIEDVVVGDVVRSYDEESGELVSGCVSGVHRHRPEEMGDFYLVINGDLCVTPNHLMYVDGGWVSAGNVSVGDCLFDSTGERVIVFSVERVFESVCVFDLSISCFSNFFVGLNENEVLVHNWGYITLTYPPDGGTEVVDEDFLFEWSYTTGYPHPLDDDYIQVVEYNNLVDDAGFVRLYTPITDLSASVNMLAKSLSNIYEEIHFYCMRCAAMRFDCNFVNLKAETNFYYPSSGDEVTKGPTCYISWNPKGYQGPIDIYLSGTKIGSEDIEDGAFEWDVTQNVGTYTLTLEYKGNIIATSDTFEISDNVVCWECQGDGSCESTIYPPGTNCQDHGCYDDETSCLNDCCDCDNDPYECDPGCDCDPDCCSCDSSCICEESCPCDPDCFPIITIQNPSAGDKWYAGDSGYISWTYARIDDNKYVSIDLYRNGVYKENLGFTKISEQSFTWNPIGIDFNEEGSGYNIKVATTGSNVISDQSDGFSIYLGEDIDIPFLNPSATKIWFLGNEENITWWPYSYKGEIDLYLDGFGVTNRIATDINLEDKSYEWLVTLSGGQRPGYGYKIIMTVKNEPNNIIGTSSCFQIKSSSLPINITSPNISSIWRAQENRDIEWVRSSAGSGNTDIDLYYEDQFIATIASDVDITNDQYNWDITEVADPQGFGYIIYLHKIEGSPPTYTLYDFSEPFVILPEPSIDVITPDTSTIWVEGDSGEIEWVNDGVSGTATIKLFRNSVYVKDIATVDVNQEHYRWDDVNVSNTGDGYEIKVTCSGYEGVSDSFTISPVPTITVNNPHASTTWTKGESAVIQWSQGGFSSGPDGATISLYQNGEFLKDIEDGTVSILDGSYTWDTVDRGPGNNFQVKVTCAGVYDFSENFMISGSESEYPVCTLSASPTVGYDPLDVEFDITAFDFNGTLDNYEIDCGDGGFLTGDIGSNPFEKTVYYTYTTPGIYEAVLTVTDSDKLICTDSVIIMVAYSDSEQVVYLVDDIKGKGHYREICYESPYNCVGSFSDATNLLDAEFSQSMYDAIMVNNADCATNHESCSGDSGHSIKALCQQNYCFLINEDSTDIEKMKITWIGRSDFGMIESNPDTCIQVYNVDSDLHEDIGDGEIDDNFQTETRTINTNFDSYLEPDPSSGKNKMYVRAGVSDCTHNHDTAKIETRYVELSVSIGAPPACRVDVQEGIKNDGNIIVENPVTFKMYGIDDKGIENWEIDFGDGNSASGNAGGDNSWYQEQFYDYGADPTGIYDATLTVYDEDGQSDSYTITIKVVLSTATEPSCNLAADSKDGVSPFMVNFTLTGSDSDGNIALWYLEFGDGNSVSGFDDPLNRIESHIYRTCFETDFTAKLTVMDNDGMTNNSPVIIHVDPGNLPPNPSVVVPENDFHGFFNGTNYSFKVSTTNHDGENVCYKIDWGDGNITDWECGYSSDDEIVFYHIWNSSGVFEIRVKAKDNDGEGDWSEPLVVKINHRYMVLEDNIDSQWIETSINPLDPNIWDIKNVNFPILGAVCIQLFSDSYPPSSLHPTDKGNVSFGVIWIFDLGFIKHKFDSGSGYIWETYFESGGVFTKKGSKPVMNNLFSLRETDEVLSLNLFLIRGKNIIGGGGSGIYNIAFVNNGTYSREKIHDIVYKIKFEISGDFKDQWYKYLSSNYLFKDNGNPYLIYNAESPVKLMFSTAVIQTDIARIK